VKTRTGSIHPTRHVCFLIPVPLSAAGYVDRGATSQAAPALATQSIRMVEVVILFVVAAVVGLSMLTFGYILGARLNGITARWCPGCGRSRECLVCDFTPATERRRRDHA
jgi:hypothetical protein